MASELSTGDRAVSWIKKGSERVRIALTTYKGSLGIDIRIFYLDEDGVWKPSGRGVRITADKIQELVAGVALIEHELRGDIETAA